MAAAQYFDQVQEAYIAYYGRPADPAGLVYWANQLDQVGGNLSSIIDAFGNSAESKALYTSGNLYAEINQIYQTLFGRVADTAGANWYVEQIQTGKMTLASIALDIYNGAQGSDSTALQAKLAYSNAFTNALMQDPTSAANYAGNAAAGNARTALGGVHDAATEQTAIDNLSTTISTIGLGTVTYLTSGADTVTGSNIVGSLTQYMTDGVGPTLNYNDTITGATNGKANTLTLNDDYANANDVIPVGASISNIQNIVLQTAGNAGGYDSAFDTTNVSGVTSVNVKSAGGGQDSVRAASTTDINVSHLSTSGNVYTQGGQNVTINTLAGDVTIGNTGIAGANPTGAVNVTAANSGTITVLGGTTVNVTDAGQNSTIYVGTAAASVSAALPSGAVTVNATGAGTLVDVLGGTDVTVNTVGASAQRAGGVEIGAIVGNAVFAPTGNVSVNVNEAAASVKAGYTSDVNVLGGANVSVTTNAGSVTIGGDATDSTGKAVLAGENATGTISVTDTSKTGTVTVLGGTDVTINAAGAGVTVGEASAIAGVNATGAVNVTETGTGAVNVYGGTDATISAAGSAVTVGAVVGTATVAPSGDITVTDTAAKAYDGVFNTTAQSVTVVGGDNVSITTNAGAVSVGADNAEVTGINPTGTVSVTNTTNAAVNVYGGTDVTVNSAGGAVTIGADVKGTVPTGNVTVTESAVQTGGQYDSSVTVLGGTNVTVNTTGGDVTIGATGFAATGAVSVTDTYVGVNADSISVIGGTTVNVTTTATSGDIVVGGDVTLNDAGTGLKDATQYASGNVTIVNESLAGTSAAGASNVYGTGEVTVNTNGATSVSIIGGTDATITDVQSTAQTLGANAGKAIGTSTLSSVSLEHVEGDSDIYSDALTSLTLLNGASDEGADVVIHNNTAKHDLTLTIGGDAIGADDHYDSITDDTAGSITVKDNGVASGEIDLHSESATALTVNTTAAAKLDVSDLDAVKAITLNNTADLTIWADSNEALKTIDGSHATGNITAYIEQTNSGFTGGSGDDVVYLEALTTTGSNLNQIDGGAGNNTLVIDTWYGNTPLSTHDTPIDLSTIATNFTNLEVDGYESTAFIDATGFTGNLKADGYYSNVTFENVAAGTTLTVGENATATYELKDSSGLNDKLTVTVGHDGNADTGSYGESGSVVAEGVESVTINSQGYVSAEDNNGNLITLTDAAAKTITVTGDENVAIDTTSGGIKTIDASAATGTVDVTGVKVAASGVAVTGGAGELIASGAPASGSVAQVNQVTVGGSYATNDVVTVTINGTNYSYTVVDGDTTASVANGLASVISNSAVTVGNVVEADGSYTFSLTANTAGTSFSSTESQTLVSDTGAITATTTVPASETSGQVDSIAISGAFLTGDVVTITINGVDYSHTVLSNDTNASIQSALIGEINGDEGAAVTATAGSGTSILVQADVGVSFSDATSATLVTHDGATTDTTEVDNATGGSAVDVFTTGSGGGLITLGTGGSNGGTGSETVNLSASAAVSDEIIAGQGAVAVYNGVAGGVTGFVVSANAKTADRLSFNGAAVSALGNNATAQNVATVVGAALASQAGAAGDVFANLTFTSTNGVLTFGAVGTHTVSEFTTAQLIAAAEAIVESAGHNTVLAFVSGGNTYVVASEDTTGGTLVNASVTELIGVTGVTGFGSSAAANTIVVDNFVTSGAVVANSGDEKLAIYDETGNSQVQLGSLATLGSTSTTISNLAAAAELDVTAGTYDTVILSQVGASGSNTLAIDFALGTSEIKSLTVTGDSSLAIHNAASATIDALVDASNTVSSITVDGTGALTISSLTDTALKTFDASASTGSLNLTASQDGLTIHGATGGDTIVASGAGDTITAGSSDASAIGAVSITANGAADKISLEVSGATHVIQATGAGDTITIDGDSTAAVYVGGTVDSTYVATSALGHGDTINLSGYNTTDSIWVGGSSTVNLGSTDHYFGGTANITVTGDVTGATSGGSFAQTVINANNVDANVNLTFHNASAYEGLAGGNAYTAQVNVASATSLSKALDLAVTQALTIDAQAHGGHTTVANGVLELNANTGLITTFQYAGNTYVVEAVNNTNAAAAHSALGTNDVVVKLTGAPSVSDVSFESHTLNTHLSSGFSPA